MDLCNVYADRNVAVQNSTLAFTKLYAAYGILFGRGIFSRLFSVSILRYLGDISFECFLIHQLVIRQYIACGGAPAISIIGNAFSIIFCVICTVLMAGLISNAKLKNKIN